MTAAAAMGKPMTVDPIGRSIGAEIQGVDLSRALDDAMVAAIEEALVRYKVLFFRDQNVTTDQHIAFGKRFGQLELHPFQNHLKGAATFKPGYPEVFVLESKPDKVEVAETWHSDVTWRVWPSLGSILRITDMPLSGGDTLWANMVAAYEGLDDKTRSLLSGLVAEHDWAGFRRRLRSAGVSEARIAELRDEYPVAEHPVVRTHPVSGESILYVNGSFTTRIKGMKEEESHALLRRLWKRAEDPELQVRLKWRPGTIAFWDNRSTQHMVVPDVAGYRRLERVTIAGDKPY